MMFNNFLRACMLTASFICWLSTSTFPCRANFHLWDIQEVYSNSDGTVQFIELFTLNNGQHVLSNHTLTSNSNVFTFPSNSPTPTTNRHLLLATPGFASLTGGVPPDYTLPENFFEPAADTLNFANWDSVTFMNAPADGIMSLNYPGPSVATNSPTNFAGSTGSLVPALSPADFSGDGDVDGDDLADWQAAYATTAAGDADLDGDSDGADFLIWQREYTGPAELSATTAIPEPTCAILIVCGVAGLLGRRKRLAVAQ